jgi:predicted nucleotidyltransferase
MIDQAAREEALRRLDEVEREDGVRLLFACESGSRAWGFPSPDSDFDVRFVYVRPLGDYLLLEQPRDVVERPIDGLWDVNGWDLKKALLLLRRGNAVIIEWLRSPIVYREHGATPAQLRRLADRFGDPASSIRHYHGLLDGFWRRDFAGREQVKLKKYLYAIRASLALAWVRQLGSVPPMALPALVVGDLAAAPVRDEIDRLLEIKSRTGEVGEGPRLGPLDAFIEDQLQWARAEGRLRAPRLDSAFLEETDRIFRQAVMPSGR